MSKNKTVLIIEDELIIAANISLQLSHLGFEIIGIISKAEEVLSHLLEHIPDIILMDINLKGNYDGIELAHLIQKNYKIPIIYLTANSDEVHFERAKATNPYAFISKPFKRLELQRAIELSLIRFQEEQLREKNLDLNSEEPYILSDCIFYGLGRIGF